MLENAASGQVFDGREAVLRAGPGAGGERSGPVAIRAEVLRYLLTAREWPVDPKGVRLRRVHVRGQLDLEAVTVRCPLVLADCEFDDSGPVAANFATVPLLIFRRCRMAGFSGDSITVAGNLALSGSRFTGAVVLSGARIGGALQCMGTRIGAGPRGISLACLGLDVRLSVHLSQGFTSDGGVVMPRANIGGELICHGAHIGANDSGNALEATGLRVSGAAYLSHGFTAQGAVQLAGVSIGGQLSCDGARLGADAAGNSLYADGMRVGGSVTLDSGPDGTAFIAVGAVRLAGAEITGSLTCRGAQLGANGYGNALVADELRTSVAVLLEGGFAAAGAVRFPGAEIRGQLRCDGIQITGADEEGCSLVCAGARVAGPAHLAGGFDAAGAVVLSGADFGGTLRLSAAHLGADQQQRSLAGDGIKVGLDMLLDDVACDGGILLAGASVAGKLDCRRARLGADQQGNSLAATQLTVGGDLNLINVTAAGAVIMQGTDIGGLLTCRGARLGANAYGNALNANGSKVGRAILLSSTPEGECFSAAGMVQLIGVQTAGSLHCEGSSLTAIPGGKAGFTGDGMKIGGSAYLSNGFTVTGPVSIRQASIGGTLDCGGATLGSDTDGNTLLAGQTSILGGVLLHGGFTAAGAISLRGASIGGELRWEPALPAAGEVDLAGAHAHHLEDDWADARHLGFWPAGQLRLAGFTYDAFSGSGYTTVGQRLDWVRSQYDPPPQRVHTGSGPGTGTSLQPGRNGTPLFATQPYRQLAEVYRQAGQEDESRAVEIAMRRDTRRYGGLSQPRKALNWILDVTIRYGYKTGRALAGILILYVIVFLAFLAAQHQGSLIAASNLSNTSLHPTATRCVTGYPCFYPAGYAFDTVVPLINIHQAEFWQVNGHHPYGWAWVLGSWTATALGWFLATLLVVGYSGLARQ